MHCLQADIAQCVDHQEQSADLRARLSAVLLEASLRYADSVVAHNPGEEPPFLRAGNVFDSPAEAHREASQARATPTPSRFSLALSVPPSGGGSTAAGGAAVPRAGRDTAATLLAAMAAALRTHARASAGAAPLTGDFPAAGREAFLAFVNLAARAPPLLDEGGGRRGWGAPARAAYLGLLQAYASTPAAAAQVVQQLVLQGQHDDYEHISWHDYFRLLLALHRKYQGVTAESRFATRDGAGTRAVGCLLL